MNCIQAGTICTGKQIVQNGCLHWSSPLIQCRLWWRETPFFRKWMSYSLMSPVKNPIPTHTSEIGNGSRVTPAKGPCFWIPSWWVGITDTRRANEETPNLWSIADNRLLLKPVLGPDTQRYPIRPESVENRFSLKYLSVLSDIEIDVQVAAKQVIQLL